MGRSILLSKEHGLNPTIPICFFCGEPKNEIALLGAGYKGEAPRSMCIDRVPCDECAAHMKEGVLFIEVRDGSTEDNPFRTGRVVVLRDEAIERIVADDALRANILEARMSFVEERVFKALGIDAHLNEETG